MIEGIVTIVGRPNVGKSTIFNKLTRSKKAIVDDQPGVTRDRLYGTVSIEHDSDDGFLIIDTGGFETKDLYFQPFAKNIVWEQTTIAIEEADVVLMVFDGKSGLHPHDKHLVQYLKKQQKRVVYVTNKIDGPEQESVAWEFYELGLDEIHSCTAAHNRGIWSLAERINQEVTESCSQFKKKTAENAVNIALIGRPNAGKSSILNRIAGESRSLVSDVAGTTRDAIDTYLLYNKKQYCLVDTAGIRRKTKISDKIESLSVMQSLRAIERADVVVLIITPDGLTDQDIRLCGLAVSKFKPVIIIVNKWDLVEDKETSTAKEFELDIRQKLGDISYLPIMFVSCLENKRIHKIMSFVENISTHYNQRVSTSKLNEILAKAVQEHTPAVIKKFGKRVKFYYATQVRMAPPTIVVKCNVAEEIQTSYKRYLIKRFRKDLGFNDIPLRVIFRGKKNELQTPEEKGRPLKAYVPEKIRTSPQPNQSEYQH
tara:strand:- start:2196 stop:3644 length:1449 start_codon:yes stop_codon:yes gene_type:complete